MNLELNGTNVIQESERGGKAASLFWPWCGANVSLLALSYGAFFLGFGISFWQATFAAIIGTVLSFYRDWETDRKSTRLNSSHRL